MTCRLASVALVVGAALADAAGAYALGYYALVAAVPVAAVAALLAFGDVLDGTAPDRRLATLTGIAAPLVLVAAASRAPLVEGSSPPVLGIAAVVGCLAVFAVQALFAASSVRVNGLRATRAKL